MNEGITVSVSMLSPLLQLLEKFGIEKNKLLNENNITENEISSADQRISLRKFDQTLHHILEHIKDKSIFLKSSRYFSILNFGVVGYMMLNSNTLEDAVLILEKYYRVISDTDHLKVWMGNKKAYISYSMLESSYKSRTYTAELILSYVYRALQILTKNRIKLDEVILSYEKPEYSQLYNEIFSAPIKFSKNQNSIVFKKSYLNEKLLQPSSELFNLFERYAKNIISRLKPENYYSSKVWQVCKNNFRGEFPKIEDVAKAFLMSGRNLQFKLKEEGTSFRQIVNEVVKEVATNYLRDVSLSIAQVSHLAGFSQPSAFNRSFKRWTGKSPGKHREDITE